MTRQVDWILRLFCLGPLFECLRPGVLRATAVALETGGLVEAASTYWATAPTVRWLGYGFCLAIVVSGPRRALLLGLAVAQIADVASAISHNTLSSGYAEKGLLLIFSCGVASMMWIDRGEAEARAARLRSLMRALATVGFAFVALNKTNVDFLDPAISCSRNLMAELGDRIPFAAPFVSLTEGEAWVSWLMELLLLPALLLFPRIGPIYVLGFFMGVALVGPRATCFVFMAIALTFLPKEDFDRVQLDARWVRVVAGVALLLSTIFWVLALDDARRFAPLQLISRVGFMTLVLWMLSLLGVNAWKQPLREPRGSSVWRGAPMPTRVIAASVLTLLLLNELSPYLGLKSKYSLTMWSNLRTDAARSNSYIVPAALRISERADRALLRVSSIRPLDPSVAPPRPNGGPPRQLMPFVASHATTLKRLRQMESAFGSLSISIERGTERRRFTGVGPGSDFESFIEETRPSVDWFDGRVMTYARPQACLGP